MSGIGDVYGFDGNKSNPLDQIALDITVMAKSLTIDFLLLYYKYP